MKWILLTAALVVGCRVPPPGTVGRKIIDCSSEAVQHNWPGAVGPTNACLTGASPTTCLLGLINPAVGITEDIIACVTRREGAEFAAAARINVSDVRSKRAGEAARSFIAERGYVFEDEK